MAAAYYLFLLVRKEEMPTRWFGLIVATMGVLLLFRGSGNIHVYLLMLDQGHDGCGISLTPQHRLSMVR